MTREETKKCIEVMQAYVDGEEIENRWKGENEGDWKSTETPNWFWNTHDYRIKPQPRKVTQIQAKIIFQKQPIAMLSSRTGEISFIPRCDISYRHKKTHLFFNPETMEWEDWDANADSRHHYNGGQP